MLEKLSNRNRGILFRNLETNTKNYKKTHTKKIKRLESDCLRRTGPEVG